MTAPAACFVLVVASLLSQVQDRPARPIDEEQLRLLLTPVEGLNPIQLKTWGAYDAAALPFYGRVLDDPKENPYLVGQVIAVIGSPDLKADRGPLMGKVRARLADPNHGVRRSAINLLARIGDSRDAVPIAALLGDDDFTVTYAAAKALSEIGDDRALVALDIWLRLDSNRDVPEYRDHIRRFRADLQARLDRTAPPPRPVVR